MKKNILFLLASILATNAVVFAAEEDENTEEQTINQLMINACGGSKSITTDHFVATPDEEKEEAEEQVG